VYVCVCVYVYVCMCVCVYVCVCVCMCIIVQKMVKFYTTGMHGISVASIIALHFGTTSHLHSLSIVCTNRICTYAYTCTMYCTCARIACTLYIHICIAKGIYKRMLWSSQHLLTLIMCVSCVCSDEVFSG
jgi:hypothetical protein